jgi:HEAT repeat protein
MKRIFLAAALALMVFSTAVHAQENMSTTRIETQHKLLSSKGKRLAQYEENLLKTLESENPTVQAQAVQAIRDLEQMYPKYPFKASLAPLTAKLKDENADGIVRRLAALALDELHSDAGDAVIKDVASSSQDKGLQTLCNALMVRSQYK